MAANEKMMLGEVTLDIVSFTNMGNQEFKNQFESFVKARMVLTMPNGEERELEVGEILKTNFQSFDEDGYEIFEEITL
jgi:hypothetical protein